jgi:hypothetical protein
MPTLPKSRRPVWAGERKPFESGRRKARWDGYNKKPWIEFRAWFRSKYPICSEPGCTQPTYYCDHTIPVLDWIAQGGNPLDPDNVKPKCFKHGNIKTGREGKDKQMMYAGKGKKV